MPSDESATAVRRTRALALLRDGVLTLAALLLSFAAFDDITTGRETGFTLEYGILLACASWLLFVTLRLIRAHRRMLGVISLVALAAGLWGQREIGPGITPGLWPAYVATASAFLWFLVVAFMLFVAGWKTHPETS